MQKWEYARWVYGGRLEFSHPQERWEHINDEEFLDLVKRLGDEGWELVSAESWTHWFKRAIP